MKYTICEAELNNNKQDILNILRRNLDDISEQRYIWNYERSPYGKPKCWLAKENVSNSFIGTATLFPRKVLFEGKVVYAGIGHKFAVDKHHRAYGPALKMQKVILQNVGVNNFKFIYTLPNQLSGATCKRAGYTDIGGMGRYVKLLSTESKLRKHIKFSLLVKPTAIVFDLIIKIFAKEFSYQQTTKFSVETPEVFDERFDVLWEKAARQFNIIGERTAEFLNWRYMQFSFHDDKIFAIVDREGCMAGYLVYYTENNTRYIRDMLCVDLSDSWETLMAKFILDSRKNNIDSVSINYFGNSLIKEKLKNFNFVLREKEIFRVLVFSPDYACVSQLSNQENWYLLSHER